ncbi:MAG: hypothetical protein ACXWUG_15445 [Polyangiales bacterium]
MRIVVTTGFADELKKLLPIAVVGIVLGVTSAFIVLNHPVEPVDAPMPAIDFAPLRAIADKDAAIQRKLDGTPLPAEVRAIGTTYLTWNELAAKKVDPRDPQRDQLASDMRSAMGLARQRLGDEKTLAAALYDLRAYHTQLFVKELERASKSKGSVELDRLAGGLMPVLTHNGWVGPGFELRVPEAILRARYKLHWTSIVFNLEDCEHSPPSTCYGLTTVPLDHAELRALLAYLVAHPVVREEDVREAGTQAAAIDRRRLIYLDRLASLDRFADPGGKTHPYLADYPYELGRGVLLFRLGQYAPAQEHFARWAATHTSDARARNWYLAAVAKARGE